MNLEKIKKARREEEKTKFSEEFLDKNLHDFLIINRINKIMCSFLDHQEVIDSIIALTNEVIDAQAVSIIIKDDQKVKITLSVSDLLDRKLIEKFKNLSLTSFSEKEKIQVERDEVEVILRENPLKVGRYVEDNFNSFHYVPITITENTYGFLAIGSLEKDAFDAEDLRCLSVLGSYSSVAIGNSILRDKIEELTIIDSLTGVYTHGYFRETLRREIRRAERYDSSFSILMLDIDDFNKINDNYGYLEGDRILKMLAMEIKDKIIREIDVVARYGGEEFVIILPETNKVRAMVVAERIRSQIELKDFFISGVNFKITISIGIASFPLDARSEAELINMANFALLKAKEQGKNKIVQA
jgi:diguanylate cyclase (GGDEF)-like protein